MGVLPLPLRPDAKMTPVVEGRWMEQMREGQRLREQDQQRFRFLANRNNRTS